jgi:hypothetical protein
MTHFRDLTPCNYSGFSGVAPMLAVGWLEPPFDFSRGEVKPAIRDRLQTLFSDPWAKFMFFGLHACGFCAQAAGVDALRADRGQHDLPRGSTNSLIPGRAVVYVVPELILHYIDEHQYRPPPPFADAVAVCPPMGSRGYFLALMAAGGDMPAYVADADSTAALQALALWRNPVSRAWCRLARTLAIGRRMSREPLWEEVLAAQPAVHVRELPRVRVVEFLARVSNAGHAVLERGDGFVLSRPDGDISVSPIGVRWVVRRQRGNVWWPHGAASNEAELERFLSSALGSPIL